MALKDILEISQNKFLKKQGLSEDRLTNQLDNLRNLISFFRMYPDLLVDFMKGPDSTFHFYFYQRIFIRIVMRHKFVYATFPRAYSKSFLSMMVLFLRCVLYPNAELFVTTGGKEQAASITIAKIEEICKLIPAFQNEIDWSRGATKKTKDSVKYVFKNGSVIDILPATQRSRGQRRTGGLMEECVLIDGDILNEVIIPTTNVNRLLPNGVRDSQEIVNKSQIYITTAGAKNTFAYQKLIELLVQSIIHPEETMVMGGTYKTPVLEGLLDKNFVDQLRMQGTFNEDSFDREYNSKWTGDAEDAFFSTDKFDKHRKLLQPEYKASKRSSKSAYYVIAADVGRLGDLTEAIVFKVTPQPQGSSLKSIVNIYAYEAEHFEDQSINLKRLYYAYNARRVVIDANGLGLGLVDFMVKSQVDPETGDILPPFGVSNDDKNDYKKYRTDDMEKDAMYIIKANAPLNTEAYSYVQTQMSSGKLKFLIDEASAKAKLMETKVGQNMTPEKRNEYLAPFVQTTILRDQMANLVQKNEGVNIILERSSRKIKKDKFSALLYGLYYIKQEEDKKKKKRGRGIEGLMLWN